MNLKKIIKTSLGVIVIASVGLLSFSYFSSIPTTMALRKFFEGGVAVPPEDYPEIERRVNADYNLKYNSQYGMNDYDHFQRKNMTDKAPIVLWVHGGAFIGGDKSDIKEYGVMLADQGYDVYSMNYHLAPEAKYPTPLHQLGEMIQHLQALNVWEPGSKRPLILAGDSAGAHIVAQFSMIQNDPHYAQQTGIEPIINNGDITSLALFCGPYDLMALEHASRKDKTSRFISDRIAWAYLGDKDWRGSKLIDTLSLVNYVNKDFPTTFITDGNRNSFTHDAEKMAMALKNHDVVVTSVFHDLKEGPLDHEYQFKMNTPQAQRTFEALLEFLP